MDRLYCSPDLFFTLAGKGIGACGNLVVTHTYPCATESNAIVSIKIACFFLFCLPQCHAYVGVCERGRGNSLFSYIHIDQ